MVRAKRGAVRGVRGKIRRSADNEYEFLDNIIQHDDGTGVCAQGGDVDRC